MFERWLDYVDRLLQVSHDRVMESDPIDSPNGEIDTIAYAMALANLSALLYRAAGLRTRDAVAQDVVLGALDAELEAALPELYQLRNALLAHPPFVDDVVQPHEALAITSGSIARFEASGGGVTPIIDVFIAQTKVPGWVARFRQRLSDLKAVAP